MKERKRALKRRYGFKHIGIFGLLLQEISIRLVPLYPKSVTGNMITALGFISSMLVLYFLIQGNRTAGLFILLSLFLDLPDGYVARNLGQSSKSGHLFDAIGDLTLYLCVLTGLYIHIRINLPFYILNVYIIDLFLRFQLGYSPLTLGPKSESKRLLKSSPKMKMLKRANSIINPFINHFDVLALLSILIIIDINLARYWMLYDLIRRIIPIIGKFAEIFAIYRHEKDYFN